MISLYIKHNKILLLLLLTVGIVVGAIADNTTETTFSTAIESVHPPIKLLYSIIYNNLLLVVGILVVGTLSYGIYSCAIVFWNGLNLGLSASKFYMVFGLTKTLGIIMPQGVFELCLILLFSSRSIIYANRLFDYFQKAQEDIKIPSIKKEFKKISLLFVLIIFSALIEFFITPLIFYKL